MKIRNGFVSNSSSSSFIVAVDPDFDHTDVAAVQKVLYGNEQRIQHEYHKDIYYDAAELAEAVVQEFAGLEGLSREEVAAEVDSGWFDGQPKMPDYNYHNTTIEERQAIWDQHKKDSLTAAQKVADKFIAQNPGKKFLHAEFADDSDIGCHLEHGGTFDNNLPHLRISHH